LNLDAGTLDITVRHGDVWTLKVEVFDAAGDPVTDLPADGWLSQVRVSKTSEVVGDITVDASNIGDGYVLLTLPALDVGSYVYDVQTPTPQTPFGGRIAVVRDVTRDDD
jgi:hypothetical protein